MQAGLSGAKFESKTSSKGLIYLIDTGSTDDRSGAVDSAAHLGALRQLWLGQIAIHKAWH
jgi:hypothetical protein